MKKFIALGTECAEYLKVAKASEGKFYCLVFDSFFAILFDFFPFSAGM
jgi:hypothetical protein